MGRSLETDMTPWDLPPNCTPQWEKSRYVQQRIISKDSHGVAPNRGIFVSICRILRYGGVRIFVFENPTVRFGADLSKAKTHGVVRFGKKNDEKPHRTVPAP